MSMQVRKGSHMQTNTTHVLLCSEFGTDS